MGATLALGQGPHSLGGAPIQSPHHLEIVQYSLSDCAADARTSDPLERLSLACLISIYMRL